MDFMNRVKQQSAADATQHLQFASHELDDDFHREVPEKLITESPSQSNESAHVDDRLLVARLLAS